MLEELTDQQIYDLIRDHWKEIRGLAKEVERRKQKIVSDTNDIRPGNDFLDGQVA